ncbi:pdcd2 domain protein [Niveomyces insectorum RCEF 264]|uniref:ESCRT-II complex subunit VPS25 n=1 Tax=Niveomyces insectorum RCEF 264 TaxID=1081102 RepID=A0A167XPF2_9HYPO|nr:pdcd2 domain protein [Niveomyces insectorum RCEF 264]
MAQRQPPSAAGTGGAAVALPSSSSSPAPAPAPARGPAPTPSPLSPAQTDRPVSVPPPSTSTSSLPLSSTSTAKQPAAPAPFTFPHHYHFPPMFTLQPNLATRRAQLDKWAALVLAYCRYYRIFRLAGGTGPAPTDRPGPVRLDAQEGLNGGTGSGGGGGGGTTGIPDGEEAPGSVAYYAPDLFHNRHIDRVLAPAAVRAVLEHLRHEGRVEYAEAGAAAAASASAGGGGGGAATAATIPTVYVYWQTPEEWAAALEAWVDETGQRGSVLTLYELTAGEGTRGTALHGLDPVVLQRALGVLVKRGKAQVFGAEESLGVKFF